MTAAAKLLPGQDPGAHRKNLIKLLEQASRRHHLWEVFGDFIELVEEAEANDPAAFFLRQQDFPNPPQCGSRYDGRSLDPDEQESHE